VSEEASQGGGQQLHLISIDSEGCVVTPIVVPTWVRAIAPKSQSTIAAGALNNHFIILGGRCGPGILLDPQRNVIEVVRDRVFELGSDIVRISPLVTSPGMVIVTTKDGRMGRWLVMGHALDTSREPLPVSAPYSLCAPEWSPRSCEDIPGSDMLQEIIHTNPLALESYPNLDSWDVIHLVEKMNVSGDGIMRLMTEPYLARNFEGILKRKGCTTATLITDAVRVTL
jgi:hypothetical protein